MINKFLILLALVSLASCGGMTKNEDEGFVDEQDNIEMSASEDSDDIVVLDEDVDEEPAQEVAESSEESDEEVAMVEPPEDEKGPESDTPVVTQNSDSQYGEYTVQSGETLGVIAAKIYGDFRKWRSIYLENESQLGATALSAGTVLRYEMPADGEVVRPSGNPYLILRNETLGTISAKTYNGETKHWRKIWKNNEKLIWNPNLIFAGLTIFTPVLDENEREIATQL